MKLILNPGQGSSLIPHHYSLVNLHQTTRLIFSTGICLASRTLTSFLYRWNASTAVHKKNTNIKYWRRAALIPQRTGTGAALAPRMKTRYIPIRARQRLMRICSCSFMRRVLKWTYGSSCTCHSLVQYSWSLASITVMFCVWNIFVISGY